MKPLHLTVCGRDSQIEGEWARELNLALKNFVKSFKDTSVATVDLARAWGEIVFVDEKIDGIKNILKEIGAQGRVIFIVTEDPTRVPVVLIEGLVTDVVVWPFRPAEVMSKLRQYEDLQKWNEVFHLNASFSQILQKLTEDTRFAERLYKSKIPNRFKSVPGFKIESRYLAGMKSGGDYFDLAESKDGSVLSVVLSNSSSYGLSAAVLSALMRITVKLSIESLHQTGGVTQVVGNIYDDLIQVLGEKDQLSIFYGSIHRAKGVFRFINMGGAAAFYAVPGQPFISLEHQGGAVSRISGFVPGQEGELKLTPEGRLILISEGVLQSMGGVQNVLSLLNEFRNREVADTLNELFFRLKAQLTSEDELPPRDCTALVLDSNPAIYSLKTTTRPRT